MLLNEKYEIFYTSMHYLPPQLATSNCAHRGWQGTIMGKLFWKYFVPCKSNIKSQVTYLKRPKQLQHCLYFWKTTDRCLYQEHNQHRQGHRKNLKPDHSLTPGCISYLNITVQLKIANSQHFSFFSTIHSFKTSKLNLSTFRLSHMKYLNYQC